MTLGDWRFPICFLVGKGRPVYRIMPPRNVDNGMRRIRCRIGLVVVLGSILCPVLT